VRVNAHGARGDVTIIIHKAFSPRYFLPAERSEWRISASRAGEAQVIRSKNIRFCHRFVCAALSAISILHFSSDHQHLVADFEEPEKGFHDGQK
jgi:hypothetical protein